MNKITLSLGFLILFSLSAFIFLFNLGHHSISAASDEVVYARVVQNILHSSDIMPLRHGGLPFYEKPPLKFWLTSIFPLILGESNFSLRLFDALLGIACILISALVAREIFGSWPAALAVGFLLLGAPEWTISHHSFRRIVLDGLLTAELLIASIFAWRAYSAIERGLPAERQLILFSLCSGIAVLTKSVAGLVPIASFGLLILLSERGRTKLKTSFFALSIAPLIFIIYVGIVFVQGKHALHSFLGMEIFHRVVHGFTGHNTSNPWYYLHYLFVRGGVTPAPLLITGLIGSLWASLSLPSFRFALIWCFFPLICYSLSSSKAPWYLNPFMPYFSMVAIFGTYWIVQKLSMSNKLPSALLSALIIGLCSPPYYRALEHHCQTVIQQTHRIPIDLVTEDLLRKNAQVTMLANTISGRASPIHGRFNVEGIYRQMLLPHTKIIKSASDINPSNHQYAFIRQDELKSLPSGWIEYRQLPPVETRPYQVTVVRYGVDY